MENKKKYIKNKKQKHTFIFLKSHFKIHMDAFQYEKMDEKHFSIFNKGRNIY